MAAKRPSKSTGHSHYPVEAEHRFAKSTGIICIKRVFVVCAIASNGMDEFCVITFET